MFNFPKIPREPGFQFKTNLLKSVTFQFGYPQNESIVKDEKYLREQLEEEFPNIKTLVKGEFTFGVSEKTQLFQQSKSSTAGSEFRTQNDYKVVSFTGDSLIITILGEAYSNYNQMFQEIEANFFPLFDKFGIDSFNRLAIRKINLTSFDIKEGSLPSQVLPIVFNKSLIDNIMFLPCHNFISTGITTSTFRNDNYQLNLGYGLLNKTLKTEHDQIVLDIDLFKTEEMTAIKDVPIVMDNINAEIFNIFNWVIQKSFLQSLGSTENIANG
jgi:uncharacterized protein (TIGR04255 family)